TPPATRCLRSSNNVPDTTCNNRISRTPFSTSIRTRCMAFSLRSEKSVASSTLSNPVIDLHPNSLTSSHHFWHLDRILQTQYCRLDRSRRPSQEVRRMISFSNSATQDTNRPDMGIFNQSAHPISE